MLEPEFLESDEIAHVNMLKMFSKVFEDFRARVYLCVRQFSKMCKESKVILSRPYLSFDENWSLLYIYAFQCNMERFVDQMIIIVDRIFLQEAKFFQLNQL